MIRKLKSGKFRIYARKPDPKTGKRRNLGTLDTREAAEKHEREIQHFKGKDRETRESPIISRSKRAKEGPLGKHATTGTMADAWFQ